MNAFVIKSWTASDQPDTDGNYVNISGRAGGLVSWVLNLLGISPTVSLIVRDDRIIFQKGSLREGSLNFITPLGHKRVGSLNLPGNSILTGESHG